MHALRGDAEDFRRFTHRQPVREFRERECHRPKDRALQSPCQYPIFPRMETLPSAMVPQRIKSAAHRVVKQMLMAGTLVRPVCCARCGREAVRILAHHPDYAFPQIVEWLCGSCHAHAHRGKNGGRSYGRLRCRKCSKIVFVHLLTTGRARIISETGQTEHVGECPA